MKIIPLIDLAFDTTNILSDETPLWDTSSAYAIDITRRYNDKLYISKGAIGELSQYYYDGTDPSKPHNTIEIATGTIETATAVICELNVTVVYVKDDNQYYLFDNSTGMIDLGGGFWEVDFTTQIIGTPVNFTVVAVQEDYRNEIYRPDITDLKWSDLGYTNKYKLLDSSLSSVTETVGTMEMSFNVNKADSVYLFNLSASSVRVKVTRNSDSVVILDEMQELAGKSKGTFYGFWFYDYNYQDKAFFEFGLFLDVKVEIWIEPFGTDAKCGLVGIGVSEYIGDTNYGATVGILDFSKVETNTNGETYLKVGKSKATNDVTLTILKDQTDTITQRLTDIRAVPMIFNGSILYNSLILFGRVKDWRTLINLPTQSKITLELESLT